MIVIDNVSKTLKGNKVLDNIDYVFVEGKIYGLFGRNGCGKTMFLRMVAGLIIPDEGTVTIDGKVLQKDISFPESTGIVIEHMEMLPEYSAYDNLKILAKINKIASDEDIIKVIQDVGLDPYSKKKVRKYSLGMKQRLNIAQAIFENQKIILLDEPTNAIDEDGIQLIYEKLKELRADGATIIMATHNKEDIEELCDAIIRIDGGRIVNE
ncbi:MAG: ABC transporter ATP-binding protein [Lachnospiraceae bacterium]|nr:ABC transporter ATP-binding protein [Lachnospiraceae bacterium]